MKPIRPRILLMLHWYWEALHEGALKYASEHGWELLRVSPEEAVALDSASYDGILSTSPVGDHPHYHFLSKAKVPVVELSMAHPECSDWGRYPADAISVGRMAGSHLRTLPVAGFVFTAHSSSIVHEARWDAFRSALSDDLRPCNRFDVAQNDADGISRFADYLATLPKPVGVFGSVDDSALIALTAAQQVNLKVPGDVYILGYGNLRLVSSVASIPISSISIDHRAWAYDAMDMLRGMMKRELAPGTVRFFQPGEIVVRSTTRDTPTGDPLCQRALELMREHISTPLEVEELARRLGVSESNLRRAFSQHLGSSVASYYMTLRMEIAKGLLSTGLKIQAVAAAVGFASPRAFHSAFLKSFGHTPGSVSRARQTRS